MIYKGIRYILQVLRQKGDDKMKKSLAGCLNKYLKINILGHYILDTSGERFPVLRDLAGVDGAFTVCCGSGNPQRKRKGQEERLERYIDEKRMMKK